MKNILNTLKISMPDKMWYLVSNLHIDVLEYFVLARLPNGYLMEYC